MVRLLDRGCDSVHHRLLDVVASGAGGEPSIVEDALACLVNLSLHDVCVEALVPLLPLTVDAIEAPFSSTDAVAHALLCVANVIAVAPVPIHLTQRTCAAAVGALGLLRADTAVACGALAVLWAAVPLLASAEPGLKPGAMFVTIASALDTHAGDATVVELGLGCLTVLASRPGLGEAGAGMWSLVLASLARHAGQEGVCVCALHCAGALLLTRVGIAGAEVRVGGTLHCLERRRTG